MPLIKEAPKATVNDPKIFELVRKAKAEKKIFIVLGGYEMIKMSLKLRGWMEKIPEMELPFLSPRSEKFPIALLLKNSPANFIWQPLYRPIKIHEELKPFVSSILRERFLNFTLKDGITNCARRFHWNYIEGVTDLNYQRTHLLSDRCTKEEFSEDFRRTALTSFILFMNSLGNFKGLFAKKGDISAECISFVIQRIDVILQYENHEDIDKSKIFDVCMKFPKDYQKLVNDIQRIVSGSLRFQMVDENVIEKYQKDVMECAEKISARWPHTKYDGFRNVWIFKPLDTSSGYGIQLENNENHIQDLFYRSIKPYVAQKYIERPLLIFNRKFDMRIYLLTIIRNGFIHVWVYKDCYIKFATNVFNLGNFNKSIHVTNYAVQKHFMNKDNAVPEARENMWTLQQLISYFHSIEQGSLWKSKIYPGIKKNLLAVIIPSFEVTTMQENNFELNGADMMLTYDYNPVIIEVNSKPALFFSQVAQEMITSQLLEDMVKVVVDHSEDANAYTGEFELVYSQEIPKVSNYQDLTITGKKLTRKSYRASTSQPVASNSKNEAKTPVDTYEKLKIINSLNDVTNQYFYLKQN